MSNVRLAITRRHIIRAAVFLAGAAAVAAMVWTIVVNFPDDPLGHRRRGDRLFTLGLLAVGFAGLLAVPGAILTMAFLRWPRAWLRKSYYTVLFLLVVANLLIFTTGGSRYVMILCWDCRLEVWWLQTIVPASVFVAVAPLVWSMQGPRIGLHADRVAGFLRRQTQSLVHEPAQGTRGPRTTPWLAAAPWLYWILARLMTAAHPTPGDVMYVVLPASYVAAYVMTLIATPLLGYRVFRDARQMSRMQKAWSLAGFAAGLACYALLVDPLPFFGNRRARSLIVDVTASRGSSGCDTSTRPGDT